MPVTSSTSSDMSQKTQGPPKPYTLYDKDGVKITVELPSALQINLNQQELYLTAPKLRNDSKFNISSASFEIKLNDVVDASSNVIANVRWWNDSTFDGKVSMTFTCGEVAAGSEGTCIPSMPGYSQVRWGTTVNSGRGAESFLLTLSKVTLTIGPLPPSQFSDGPIVQVG